MSDGDILICCKLALEYEEVKGNVIAAKYLKWAVSLCNMRRKYCYSRFVLGKMVVKKGGSGQPKRTTDLEYRRLRLLALSDLESTQNRWVIFLLLTEISRHLCVFSTIQDSHPWVAHP